MSTWAEEEEAVAAKADPELEAVLALVEAEHPGMGVEEVFDEARQVLGAVRVERRRRLVRHLVDDAQAVAGMNLAAARAVVASEFLRERTVPPRPCLGGLLAEGHNGLLVAQYKAGKSTIVENAALALTTGEPFLGVFDVPHPYRVALLNFELTADDCRARLQALGFDDEAAERLLVVHLRGVHLSLTSPAGRKWLTAQLADHRTEVVLLDTYSAASAPCVESENDNAGARRFLLTWDQIKADAGVHTSLVTHHTGRAQHLEGEEHGRGATVLDDWCDVRVVLTRDRKAGSRFLASEGRSPYQLPESRLMFDEPTRRLTLTEANIGEGRARARANTGASVVAQIVSSHPGITTTELRDALGEEGLTNNADKAAAILAAKTHGLVHEHRDGHTKRHHTGPVHAAEEPCPSAPNT